MKEIITILCRYADMYDAECNVLYIHATKWNRFLNDLNENNARVKKKKIFKQFYPEKIEVGYIMFNGYYMISAYDVITEIGNMASYDVKSIDKYFNNNLDLRSL